MVDIDRIQICTKDKNRTIIRNIHYIVLNIVMSDYLVKLEKSQRLVNWNFFLGLYKT